MPCVRKSTLSSALAAATATLSSMYSGPVPAATSAAVPTGFPAAASSAVVTGAAAQATGASGASTVPTATGNQTTYAGINIAGFDFGCGTDGTCTVVCSRHAYALGIIVADREIFCRMALPCLAPVQPRCSTSKRMMA